MLLTVVIPAYNERKTILEVLRRVQATPFDKEIVVVDDGSTDGTREILRGVTEPNVRPVFHERNLGKGGAVRTGFAAARGEFVIVQDADLEYDPGDYATLLGPLLDGSADAVFGSRFVGNPRKVNNYWHAVGNKLLTALSNMTTNLDLTDLEGGLKAYRRDLLGRIELESPGFEVEPELVAKVARLRARVYEVPISYRGRSYAEGKKIGWKDGVKAIATIVKYGPLAGGRGGEPADPLKSSMAAVEGLEVYNTWLWRQLERHVGQRVLEAGSGSGTITRYLVGRGRVVCVDHDEPFVEELRARYATVPSVEVKRVDLAAQQWAPLAGERFDTVLCMNVLEHLPDDAQVLRGFHEVLEPGGRVVLLVPAGRWLYGALDRAVGHYRRYEPCRLLRLLEQSGFVVEELRHLNPTGVAGWFLNSRLLGRRAISPRQTALYDKAFPLLRHAERLGLPFGLSLLAVGRKPVS
jgi:glycosyltransferase involved in cell wall biosynthesis/phospholipid N-methyltransferase